MKMTTILTFSDSSVVDGVVAKLAALPPLPDAVEMPGQVPDEVMPAEAIRQLLDAWAILLENQMDQADEGAKWVDGLVSAPSVPSGDYVVGL